MAMQGPRGARPEEIPAIVKLADSVFRANQPGSMGEQFPLLYDEENAENLRIFADAGRPVSLVGMVHREVVLLGTRHRACEIGSVCTDPEYRGQGLATRLLKDARGKAVADGCDMFLISGARGLYLRQGYVAVGGFFDALVTPDSLPQGSKPRVTPWDEDSLPDLVRLHSAEPVRFVRPPEDFHRLLETGTIINAPAQTRLIAPSRKAAPTAYVSYTLPGTRGAEEDELIVAEMAGSRRAVALGLGELFGEYGVNRIRLRCINADLEMAALARESGWEVEPHDFHGTVGIIEPERFWDACAPLFRERIGDARFGRIEFRGTGGARISYGNDSLKLDDMTELTKLAFLARRRRDELDLGLAADSELRALLGQLFPLPLVGYGLNFV